MSNIVHIAMQPHRLPLIFLLFTLFSVGQAQHVLYLDPLHSVEAFPGAIRAGTASSAVSLIAVFSQDKSIKVFDASNLSERATFTLESLPIMDILFSKQASLLYSARGTGQIEVWDISKKARIKQLDVSNTTILSMAETPQQQLLVAGFDKIVKLIDVATGKTVQSAGRLQDDIVTIGVDSSGSRALVVTVSGSIQALSLPQLKELGKSDTRVRILRAALSSNGKWIALGTPEGKVRLWDVGASVVRASFEESRGLTTSLAFDPGNRWLVAASADSTVRFYDLSTNSLVKSIAIAEGYVTASSFVGPELLWMGTSKGTIRTWNVRETPRDTTPPVITVLQPEELRKVYGTSVLIKGLVRDENKIKGISIDAGSAGVQVADAQGIDKVPGLTSKSFEVYLQLENVGENTFSIKAIDESGNVARHSLTIQRLSGDQVIEIINPPNNFEADQVSIKLQFKLWCEAATYQVSVNLLDITEKIDVHQKKRGVLFSEEIPLYVGYNKVQITVVTKSGEKLTKISGVNRKVYGAISTAPVNKPLSKERGFEPQLWAVVVGVSEYANKAIPALRFADRDAEAFAAFLQKPEGGGFQADHMRLLVNKNATLANLKEALVEFLSQAIDKDLVIIFFAGHGAPDPARPSNLYMLTHDTEPGRLGTTSYPMWELQTLLMRQLSAKRIIVFSDACHSGGISMDFATRGVNATESNLVNQYLAELGRTKEGMVIFTASAAGEVSQELPEFGHGIFTHYLLEGMKGEADLNNDYTVTINELMQYVEEQVKRKTKGAQNPTRSQTSFDKDLTISKIAH